MAAKSVLVIGSGGREHAIIWKLAQSKKVSKICALPGSPRIAQLQKVELVKNINDTDFKLKILPTDKAKQAITEKVQRAGVILG